MGWVEPKATGFLVQILKTLYLSVFKTPQNLRLTLVAGEFGYGDDGESGQVVGHFLLVGLVAGLDPALVQSVVVLEHKQDEVPQDACVQQVGLKPLVTRKFGHRLRSHTVQPREVLCVCVCVWRNGYCERM